jgi:hypothetical protein
MGNVFSVVEQWDIMSGVRGLMSMKHHASSDVGRLF